MSYEECYKSNRFEQTYRLTNPATNLFYQGRVNYAFDQNTRLAASLVPQNQAGGIGTYGQLQTSGVGQPIGAPLSSSIGGTFPQPIGSPLTSNIGGAFPQLNTSGYGGQVVPGVNTSGLRNFP